MLALLVIGVQAFAQTAVSGRVTDESGEPLVGVNVLVRGTTTGDMTDLDGYWSIPSVRPGSVLVFSSVGFATQEATVGNRSVINIVLKEDTNFLEEVVVVGYGTAKRKDLTGSLSQIDNRLIAAQNTSSASKALEGAIPGLVYSSIDGQPGNDAGIRVRGLGSTSAGNSDALVVIDGIPVTQSSTNPLSNMNQEDIASITVLKDAASTAIYGSRGANGVILVTTKNGQSGRTKVSFQSRIGWNTVGSYKVGQVDDAAGIYEYVWQSIYNSYRYGANGAGGPALGSDGEYYTNVNNPNSSHEEAAEFASAHLFNYLGSNTSFGRNTLGNYMAYKVPGAIYTPDGTGASASATMSGAYLVNTDGKINPNAVLLYDDTYADALLQTGFRQQYDISASGGSEKEDHYVSFGYLSDPSYVPNSAFNRFTGRAKMNVQLFKWLKVGTNVSFTRSKTNYQGTFWQARNSGSNQGSITRFVNGHTPIVPVYAHDADGNYIYDANGELVHNYNANSTYSPLGQTGNNYGSTDILYSLDNDVRQDLTSTLNTRTYFEIPFLQHFTYRTDFSYDKINTTSTVYYNGETGRAKSVGGAFSKKLYDTQIMDIQNRLTYNQDFGKHHVDALALFESYDWEQENVLWGSTDEFIPGFLASGNFVGRYNGVGQANNPGYGHNIERMKSWLGRANYIYADKYYLSGSIRRDGSSKFRKENRWGTFWSVGAGWRFTEEPFMENVNWITNGKLRGSYGVIGNQNGIGRYQTYRTWSYSTTYNQTTGGTGVPTGDSYRLTMGGLVNTQLTWEETNTLDIGLDLSLLNRIDITLDWYKRVTGNSQFTQPVSYLAMGQTSLPSNIAEITNKGIELDINADIIRTKDIRWNLAFNISHYTNRLTDLPESAIPAQVEGLPEGTWEAYDGGAWSSAGGVQQSSNCYLRGIGRDWFNLYLYKYAGVDQNTGLPMYWHRVTEEDHANGKYTDVEVGGDVKTNNYANASKYEVGSPVPAVSGGFNTSFSWKGLYINAQFAYQIGGKYYSHDYGEYLYNVVAGENQYRMMFVSDEVPGNTWTPDNTGAYFPMQWYPSGSNTYFSGTSTNGGGWNFTDIALFDASYLRLKNVTIGYNFSKALLSKLRIDKVVSGVNVYASADNLFLLSAAKGLDPTMSASGGYIDVAAYTFPNMRTFTVGINLDF